MTGRLEFSPLTTLGLIEASARYERMAGMAMMNAARWADQDKPVTLIAQRQADAMGYARLANAVDDALNARRRS